MLQKIKNAFYRKFKTSFAKSGLDLQFYQMFKQKSYGFLKEDLFSPLLMYMESLGYILTVKTVQGQFVGI